MEAPKKVVLFGIDAPVAKRVLELAEKGLLPTFKRLIDTGVYAKNCMVPFPTITPPNWTTIVTGAWPGTHGITCFNVHNPGDALDKYHQGFDSRDCKSEHIWNAVERSGKKTIVMNYPSSWPATFTAGVQLGGAGLSMNEWRTGLSGYHYNATFSEAACLTTEDLPKGTRIVLEGPEPSAEVELPSFMPGVKFEDLRVRVRPVASGGKFRSVEIGLGGKKVCELEPGKWSARISATLLSNQGPKGVVFRAKLLHLSEDGKNLRLFITPMCATSGWARPEGFEEKLKDLDGLPLPYGPYSALTLGWIDDDTWVEELEMQQRWYAEAARAMMREVDWSLLVMHTHAPDWAYHSFVKRLDPKTEPDAATRERFLKLDARMYQVLDALLARVVEAAGKDALVVVVSDHGVTTSAFGHLDVGKILDAAGLRASKEDGGTDVARSKVVLQRSCYIYVNLKGRDPGGVVEPEDYEKVREEVIKCLYDYTDPKTGIKPFSFVLKREEARVLGLYGDRVGDIVYALRAEYGGQHGNQLTTGETGFASMRGLLILSGPGVKKGVKLERNVWLTDVVPTVCHLSGLPIPADAEGGVVYQALEEPDGLWKRISHLEQKCAKLEAALGAEKNLTHTYNT